MADYMVSSDEPHLAKQKVEALATDITTFLDHDLPSYTNKVLEAGKDKVGAANEALLMQFQAVSTERGGLKTSLGSVVTLLTEVAMPNIFKAIWQLDGVAHDSDPNRGKYE